MSDVSKETAPRIAALRKEPLPAPVHDEAFTRSFLASEGEHHFLRLAKAIRDSWLAMPMSIREHELLVGGSYLQQVVTYHYCGGGIGVDQRLAQRLQDATRDEKVLDTIAEAVEYWKDKTLGAKFGQRLRQENLQVPRCTGWVSAGGCTHLIPDFAKVLRIGLRGVIEEIRKRLPLCDDPEKGAFLRALILLAEGMIAFAKRHAALAAQMAAKEARPERKAELEKIAAVCDRVPEYPARGFHEAIQSFWFVHLLDGTGGHEAMLDSPGRFDQYLYPYYRQSIARGDLTDEQIQELIDCFWLKANEPSVSWNLCIGGQTPDGRDASNELTLMCLSATERLHLPKPNLSFRWHAAMSDEIFFRALEVIRKGSGFPAVYNDESLVPALIACGVSPLDARDYAMGGCSEVSVSAKSNYGNEDADLSITKMVEYALHDGRCVLHGTHESIATGDPAGMASFEDVLRAYKRQVEHCVALMCRACNLGQEVRAEWSPRLVRSLLTDDCIERGLSIDAGGARYNGGQFFVIGLANTADSLTAIQWVVFDKKLMDLPELIRILDSNYEGREDFRQYLLNTVPKFGNDNAVADEMMAEVSKHVFLELKKHKAYRGGVYGADVVVLERNITMGKSIAATPDGRRSGDPVSDSIGPMAGADRLGPTAAINSIGKVDQVLAPGGVILNLKFSRNALAGKSGIKNLAALLKRYFALKGQQVQITVADRATLLDAQAHPEKHRTLMVRVGGYSGRFVDFDKELQAQIIARTEMVF